MTDGDIQDFIITDNGLTGAPILLPSASPVALFLIVLILALGPALAGCRRTLVRRRARQLS